ncbi:SMI1/KNR4 family protein [Streptomyces sp. NPDC001404]|uniref:SMI1/KNR4 family protein n=1 Tax=Streptomyces sp. NPDC001404 TaxID=3364571 RepID=UPI00368FA9C5
MAGDVLMLHALESAVPELCHQRPESGRMVNWDLIEGRLRTGLPADYKELAEAYPPFVVDEFLSVHIPRVGLESAFCEGIASDLEALTDLIDEGEAHGYSAHPDPGGLIPFASSFSGDTFYWRNCAADPSRWPVVVSGANDDWWEFPGGIVEFLTAWLDGTMDRRGLPADVPSMNPHVQLYGN